MLSNNLIGKIIQCHIDQNNPESFVVGRLAYTDSDWFIMQDITPEGRWNGLALYMQADIVQFEENTDYIRKLEGLLRYRNKPVPILPPMSEEPLKSLLVYAKKKATVIGIELCASGYRDVNGTIDFLENQTVGVMQIDEFGLSDGKSYLAVDAITRCFVDDEESMCLEIIHKQNK